MPPVTRPHHAHEPRCQLLHTVIARATPTAVAHRHEGLSVTATNPDGEDRPDVERDHHRLGEAPQGQGERNRQHDQLGTIAPPPGPPPHRAGEHECHDPTRARGHRESLAVPAEDRGERRPGSPVIDVGIVGLVHQGMRGGVELGRQWCRQQQDRRERGAHEQRENVRRRPAKARSTGSMRTTTGWVANGGTEEPPRTAPTLVEREHQGVEGQRQRPGHLRGAPRSPRRSTSTAPSAHTEQRAAATTGTEPLGQGVTGEERDATDEDLGRARGPATPSGGEG